MDPFAQTGAQQDDLFDDIEESMQTRAQDDLFGDDFIPVTEEQSQAQPQADPPLASQESSNRGRGDAARGRGRGRGRGGRTHSGTEQRQSEGNTTLASRSTATPVGLLESRHAPKPKPTAAPTVIDSTPPPAEEAIAPGPAADPPANAPTAPRVTKTAAVRGDRLATGGAARTKLTEEELTARMASIRLKNENLEAAHARAQADAESFAARENEAAEKRQAERRDRQQMMGEREKNRQRKLKAQEGREWDSEKREEDFADSGRRGYGRGAYGGVTGTRMGQNTTTRSAEDIENDGREYLYREDRSRGRGRGRGGTTRGGRGGASTVGQGVPARDDFPALAATVDKKKTDEGAHSEAPVLSFPSKRKGSKTLAAPNSIDLNGGGKKDEQSWADIVEESKS